MPLSRRSPTMKPLPWPRDSWTCTASIGLRSKANARFVRSRTWSHRSNRTSEGQTPPVARRRRIIGPSKNQLQLIPHDPPTCLRNTCVQKPSGRRGEHAIGHARQRESLVSDARTMLSAARTTLGNAKVLFLPRSPRSATPKSCLFPARHARQRQSLVCSPPATLGNAKVLFVPRSPRSATPKSRLFPARHARQRQSLVCSRRAQSNKKNFLFPNMLVLLSGTSLSDRIT